MSELKTDQAFRISQQAVRNGSTLGLCVVFALLAGCASNEPGEDRNACVKGNFEQVTFCPGASAICTIEPCTALFQMPPGEGEYKVTSNNIDLGTFPAGQTVYLGAFWGGAHYIEVQGSDAPAAHFWVSQDM